MVSSFKDALQQRCGLNRASIMDATLQSGLYERDVPGARLGAGAELDEERPFHKAHLNRSWRMVEEGKDSFAKAGQDDDDEVNPVEIGKADSVDAQR